jgi:hypothetical protein
MTQLKIKSRIDNVRMDILLSLLNSWGLETEVISEDMPQSAGSVLKSEGSALSQAQGIWADYDIDVKYNRLQTRARRTKSASTI